jgi:hypothetical protein
MDRSSTTPPNDCRFATISVLKLLLRSATGAQEYVAVTPADRKPHMLNPSSSTFKLIHSYKSFQDSPILDVVAIGRQYLLVASISGKVV